MLIHFVAWIVKFMLCGTRL